MRLCFIIFAGTYCFCLPFSVNSQPIAGTTGLLNTPTAEMQPEGTFFMGANYLPNAITPDFFSYNTGNYYFNITFLPFLEVSYKLTLIKVSNNHYNQDRSVMVRGRLFRESRLLPSIVLGVNDIYSTGIENQYFNAGYWVATKSFRLSFLKLQCNAGQQSSLKNPDFASGFFGGISLTPLKNEWIRLMAEYDGKSFNTGLSTTLFNHVKLYGFAYDMKHFTGGIQYFINLNKNKNGI